MATGKQDVKKESLWRRTIQQQVASGNSVRAWCRRHGVTESAFYWWRRELSRRDKESQSSSFVPVHVTTAKLERRDPQIEIVLTDGRRVRVHDSVDRQMLADVLGVLTSMNPSAVNSGPNCTVEPERRAC